MTEPERPIDDRIADWVDGRLEGRDRERFVAELRVNAQLRKDLEQYERTVAAVRAALQAPTAGVQLADRVLAAIASGQTAVQAGRAWRVRPIVWSVATAAALLVAALLVNSWSAPRSDLTASLEARDELSELGTRKPKNETKVGEHDGQPSSKPLVDDAREVAKEVARPAGGGGEEPRDGSRAAEESLRAATGAPGADPATTSTWEQEKKDAERRQAQDDEASRQPVYRLDFAEQAGAQPPAASPVPPAGTAAPAAPAANASKVDAEDKRVEENAEHQFGAEKARGQSRSRSGREQPLDMTPMIVVEGTWKDTKPGARVVGGGEKGPTTGGPATPQLLAQIDAFLREQTTPSAAKGKDQGAGDATRTGMRSLQLHRLDARVSFQRRLKAPAAEGAQAGDEKVRGDGSDGSSDRIWLVEGTQVDVQILLQRLATFAADGGLQLRTGEAQDLPVALPSPEVAAPADRAASDTGALPAERAEARTRVVIQFRSVGR